MTDSDWEIERPSPHVEMLVPRRRTAPLVFASPHSGRDYPEAFVAASQLDPIALRRSEDSFVDELYLAAPSMGAPLLRALFPRAFIDPNREPFELDPEMFSDSMPAYVNIHSPRIAGGLGTIAKVVTSGQEIYSRKLTFAEAANRINTYYRPYHKQLRAVVDATRSEFGHCLLIDCHSMPSVGGPMDPDPGRRRVDFVLGNCFGAASAPGVIDLVEETLRRMGYVVVRNRPYSGGFTTVNYGRPKAGVHALQIEVNRALYMDEETIERADGLARLADDIGELIAVLTRAEKVPLAAE